MQPCLPVNGGHCTAASGPAERSRQHGRRCTAQHENLLSNPTVLQVSSHVNTDNFPLLLCTGEAGVIAVGDWRHAERMQPCLPVNGSHCTAAMQRRAERGEGVHMIWQGAAASQKSALQSTETILVTQSLRHTPIVCCCMRTCGVARKVLAEEGPELAAVNCLEGKGLQVGRHKGLKGSGATHQLLHSGSSRRLCDGQRGMY